MAFSWTRIRTPGQAIKCALRKSWEKWSEANAEDVPQDIQDMIEEIPDNADIGVKRGTAR